MSVANRNREQCIMSVKDLFDPAKNIYRSIEKVITYGASQRTHLKAEISEYIEVDPDFWTTGIDGKWGRNLGELWGVVVGSLRVQRDGSEASVV